MTRKPFLKAFRHPEADLLRLLPSSIKHQASRFLRLFLSIRPAHRWDHSSINFLRR